MINAIVELLPFGEEKNKFTLSCPITDVPLPLDTSGVPTVPTSARLWTASVSRGLDQAGPGATASPHPTAPSDSTTWAAQGAFLIQALNFRVLAEEAWVLVASHPIYLCNPEYPQYSFEYVFVDFKCSHCHYFW